MLRGGISLSTRTHIIYSNRIREATPRSARHLFVEGAPTQFFYIGPPIRQENPLNLSILLSGGKENNCDFPSNCE